MPPRDASLSAGEWDAAPSPTAVTRTSEDNAITSTNSSNSNLEQQSELVTNRDTTASHQAASGPTQLEQQRQGLVDQVVEEARKNKKAPLDEVGRQRFEQAGFGDLIDKKGEVEVETHWLKPVVQVSHPRVQFNVADSTGNHHPQDTYRVDNSD